MSDFKAPQPAHTPGPWQCLQAGDGPTKFAVADAEGVSILTIVEEEGHDFAAVYRDEDARLIAAAPELLDMAECLRAVCARVIEQYGPVQCGVDFAALGGSVNRVIAKANGETA